MNSNTRFSGIYDEAGMVGTLSALMLAARKFDLRKDVKCRWLLLYLLMSFSLAGYLLAFLYLFIKWIKIGQWKICVGIVLGLICLNIFINTSFENPMIKKIQNRIQITQEGINIVNNRQTSTFEKGYSEFLEAPLKTKLFGFGMGASSSNGYLVGSSTYKLIIYDYGYFGFALRIAIILLLFKRVVIIYPLRHWNSFALLFIFMVSIYQRPGIYFAYYFIVLFGGCSFAERTMFDEQEYYIRRKCNAGN